MPLADPGSAYRLRHYADTLYGVRKWTQRSGKSLADICTQDGRFQVSPFSSARSYGGCWFPWQEERKGFFRLQCIGELAYKKVSVTLSFVYCGRQACSAQVDRASSFVALLFSVGISYSLVVEQCADGTRAREMH